MRAVLVREAVGATAVASALAHVDAHPAWLDRDGADPQVFNRFSSSLRAASIEGFDLLAWAKPMLDGPFGVLCRERLGAELSCDVDACWVRRQYAPADAPVDHHAHAWHQDGALGHDFIADPEPAPHDLLDMVTCWVALTACGDDAPGLEMIVDAASSLLPVAALDDRTLRDEHSPGSFWRPTLAPGDALVFDGATVHRTHARPSMRHARTSLELRFFPSRALPARLAGDRFAALH